MRWKNRFVNNCDILTIFLMPPSRLIPICLHAVKRRNNVFTGPMFAMQLKSIYSATLLKTSHYPYLDSAHKFLRNTTGDRYRNLTYQTCTFTIDNPRQMWASGKPSYIIITIKNVIKQKNVPSEHCERKSIKEKEFFVFRLLILYWNSFLYNAVTHV